MEGGKEEVVVVAEYIQEADVTGGGHPGHILTSLRKRNLPDLRNWIQSISTT